MLDQLREQALSIHVGDVVRLKPDAPYASDWPEPLLVIGISWDYQTSGELNIAVATQDQIECFEGAADGWRPEHFIVECKALAHE